MKTIAIIVIVLIIFLGLGFLLFQQSNKPPADLPGIAYEIQGANHAPSCVPGEPPYNSNPPTSGCHDPKPATWGVHNEGRDEVFIHNLEHGGIWIAYKPELDQQQVEQLKDFTRRYRKIIVASRSANDANIVFAAWGRLQKFDQYDESSMLKFIDTFYDKGPEKAD